MTEQRGARPDHIDVMDALAACADKDMISTQILGKSTAGYEIPCCIITNPQVDAQHKQRALIIAGQHGSEESGRAIALGLIDFLLSDDPLAQAIRDKQEVAIIPSCNPEGAQLNTYHNAADIDIAHVHLRHVEPETPDALCVWRFANDFLPELFIDIHGLAGGSMADRVWLEPQHQFSVNRYFMMHMCEAARTASEAAGFPCCEPRLPRVINVDDDHKRIGSKLSYLYNTLAFGVEAIEDYYRIDEWVPAGLARIKALLVYGQNDQFGLAYSGYPNALIAGHRVYGLMASGNNAQERRQSRAQITQHLTHNFTTLDRNADGHVGALEISISSKTKEEPALDHFAVIARIKQPADIQSIRLDGEIVNNYQCIDEGYAYTLVVPIQKLIGTDPTLLRVAYDSPYLKK